MATNEKCARGLRGSSPAGRTKCPQHNSRSWIAGLWGTVQLVFIAALAGMIAGSVLTLIYSPQKSVTCPDATIAPLEAQNNPARAGH